MAAPGGQPTLGGAAPECNWSDCVVVEGGEGALHDCMPPAGGLPYALFAAGVSGGSPAAQISVPQQTVVCGYWWVPGEVSERLKEHAWKVCIRQRIAGSNPALSAKLKKAPVWGFFYLVK